MARCPNCGRETKRTVDWCCQWCGYPLFSGSYKKIDKTYKELKDERTGTVSVDEEPEIIDESEEETVTEEEYEEQVEEEVEEEKPASRVRAVKKARPEPEPEPKKRKRRRIIRRRKPQPEPEVKEIEEYEDEEEEIEEEEEEEEEKPVKKPKPVKKGKAKSKPEPEVKPRKKRRPEPEPEPEIEEEDFEEEEVEEVPEIIKEPVKKNIVSGKPELVLTVDKLISTYENEGPEADAKFSNKILRVTGIISRIDVREAQALFSLTLEAEKSSPLRQSVRCIFSREHGNELQQLVKSQTVTVQGKYDGSIINISMRDCFLVK